MTTITFDTYELIKKLRDKGVSEDLAESQVEAMKEVARQAVGHIQHEFELDDLATKRDLKDVEAALKRDIEELRRDMDARFVQLEQRLIIKLGALMAVSVGVVAALVKLL